MLASANAVEQIVGRERRERVSQLAWCGEGCFDSRRRVNSDVRRSSLNRSTVIIGKQNSTGVNLDANVQPFICYLFPINLLLSCARENASAYSATRYTSRC